MPVKDRIIQSWISGSDTTPREMGFVPILIKDTEMGVGSGGLEEG